MNISLLLHGIGSVPLFSSRAFLPAFMTAVILRFGDSMPFIATSDFLKMTGTQPSWFTTDGVLISLGVLAILEIVGDKNAEIRQLLHEFTGYMKSSLAALTYLGIISVSDANSIKEIIQQAGFVDIIPTLMVGYGVYSLNRWQNLVFFDLEHGDEDDDLGIQSAMSWGKDLFAAFGMLAIIFFPIVMIVFCAIISSFFSLLSRRAQAKEEQSKISCANCNLLMYTSASACPQCKTDNKHPTQIGFLGQSIDVPVIDLADHQLKLIEMKRCSNCANRLTSKNFSQTCSACGKSLMKNKEFAKSYLKRVQARIPLTLGITFVLSLIPVVGLVPGVIYYRFKLAGPFRRYLPIHKNMLNKILIQLVMVILIVWQVIPGFGSISVPVMALITFIMYRRSFLQIIDTLE